MPRSGFWLRRLKDGDVLESSPAPVTPDPESAKADKGKKKD